MIYLTSPSEVEGTVSLPMIAFSLLGDTLELNRYELLIFTSKQAVKSTELLNPLWKKLPCISIGSSTSQQIEAFGGTVVHQANTFDAKTLSKEILAKYQNKKMLYLRPKVVSFDMKSFLHTKGLDIAEQEIYETLCIAHGEDEKPVKNAIIIFTSPSTVKCFFHNFTWDESYTAILIGESTKAHLPKNVKYKVARTPTIEACIVKAKQLIG